MLRLQQILCRLSTAIRKSSFHCISLDIANNYLTRDVGVALLQQVRQKPLQLYSSDSFFVPQGTVTGRLATPTLGARSGQRSLQPSCTPGASQSLFGHSLKRQREAVVVVASSPAIGANGTSTKWVTPSTFSVAVLVSGAALVDFIPSHLVLDGPRIWIVPLLCSCLLCKKFDSYTINCQQQTHFEGNATASLLYFLLIL